MEGPTSHFYFSQRLRLHYVDWGNPDAPPLLLIHGGRDHCRNWDWVARRLADRYHIIAPDLRGHGDSAWAIGGGYDQAAYLYDIAQLVHQTRIAPVTIIAHSLGAGIALNYCGTFPETVSKVIAIEGLGPSPKVIAEQAARSIDQRLRDAVKDRRENSGRAPRRYASLEEATARMAHENPHLSPEQARHLTVYGAHQNEDDTWSWKFDNHTRWGVGSLSHADQHHLWRQITAPVLLVRGAESWASDPVLDGRIANFQNARLVNFEGAGHWVHHDKLEEFMAETEAFLAE
ncbi:MAG: alpha/beta hydrolase [Phenylobacterium sp.]|uniref:alpha/beta fold hydrolase n=1 Tax=Phenylobacterium sp. TaxID=1871053 RepID=UPI001B59CF39|nr:alpha/beta hydrolase [Phenylobacterium sp.]MBP7650081.1 alpha/beta hydrolase [Phenylobacterium sp.]MBP7814641.1 alpha/beta hydrolase [Phenylobacterium sp.]MBP9232379.1 alpha/beta hydrolase [Phenylobacterium sp.]